jgi:hypothetical protein
MSMFILKKCTGLSRRGLLYNNNFYNKKEEFAGLTHFTFFGIFIQKSRQNFTDFPHLTKKSEKRQKLQFPR